MLFLAASRVATTSRCLIGREAAAVAASTSSSSSSSASPLHTLSSSLRESLPSTSSLSPAASTLSPPRRWASTAVTQRRRASSTGRNVGLSKAERREGQLRKRANLEKQGLRARLAAETAPDPVLGYRPGNKREPGTNDEGLWENCELKSILLSKEEAWGLREDRRGNLLPIEGDQLKVTEEERRIAEELGGPLRLNFGLDEEDRRLLFQDLRTITEKDRFEVNFAMSLDSTKGDLPPSKDQIAEKKRSDAAQNELDIIHRQEMDSTMKMQRILDLRNASGKGIDVENKRRIVRHFGNGVDTGSVETQTAVITYRLHLLHDHLSQPAFRNDEGTRRSMALLIHKRAKLLKYLKRESPQRYFDLLPRVGVNIRAVEGEVVVPGKPKLTASSR